MPSTVFAQIASTARSHAFLDGGSQPSSADMIPIFGSSSVASDVFNGKRSISKAHARKLAEFFHVSVSLFI
jgi:antitoxin component HigA of HigAB toxin-antitoxin module